ncbi:hypothetical protein KAX02_13735 [candidate division WOR-3 bacterium]|nr:hypothetical protein [candidate division WOR-3 bacterium]
MNRVMGSDKDTQLDLEGLPRHVALTVAAPTYQMKVSDIVLSVISAAADAAGIVTLPSVAEAVGKFYYLVAPTGLAGGDISFFEKETAALIVTSPVGPFNADGDYAIIYSNGASWLVVMDGVA